MRPTKLTLARLESLLLTTASEEDFEDRDDTGLLPADKVKTLKDELKEVNSEWKAQLKTLKSAAGDLFTEIDVPGVLPKGAAERIETKLATHKALISRIVHRDNLSWNLDNSVHWANDTDKHQEAT